MVPESRTVMTVTMEYLLMYQGTPLVVSTNDEKLHRQAVAEAKLSPDTTHRTLEWNVNRTRLFRKDHKGHARFTGYEVKPVVRA